jgi:hypothetical protein
MCRKTYKPRRGESCRPFQRRIYRPSGLVPKTANPRLTPWANFSRTSGAENRTNFIHGLLVGTPLENHGYEYFGKRA